jgi:hypothetical protein
LPEIISPDYNFSRESCGRVISYFHPDHLGSTTVLTNSSGVKEEEDVVYYPYREIFTIRGTASVAYKYTGKELDTSTGLLLTKPATTTLTWGGLFQRIPL